MADLQAGDKFIVNRGDTVQKTEAVELMATIQDSDWLLVNRADAVKNLLNYCFADILETY